MRTAVIAAGTAVLDAARDTQCSAQFITEASRVKVTPGEEVTSEMVANYRKNVQGYIDGKSEKILKDLKGSKKSK